MAGNKYALVIGVSEYENVPKLKYGDKDARDVAVALRVAGFEDSRLLILHDKDTEAPPTRDKVFHHLGRLKTFGLDADDLVLFYFSGHGMMQDNVDYLLPIGASDLALQDTALPVDIIVNRLQQTGSRQVVMFIDACRDELPTGKSVSAIGANTKSVIDKADAGFAAIFSCESRERSFEIDTNDIKQSSFTYCLLDAIKSPRTNTVAEVADYLRKEVKNLNGKYGLKPQLPYLYAKPDALRRLAIFVSSAGVPVELDQYMAYLTEQLYGNDLLTRMVYYDVMEFLSQAEHTPGLLRLVRDVCKGKSTPDQFEQIWKNLRTQRRTKRVVSGGAVGGPGTFPDRSGAVDG